MDPVQTDTTNLVLGEPKDWPHANTPIGKLPITRTKFNDEVPGFLSYWKPSEEELETLNAGGVIQVGLLGDNHPPVMLDVIGARPITGQ